MENPLVSIVCLCYNQGQYLREAVSSVLSQSYKPIQLILVDDASTDGSATVAREIKNDHPRIECLLLEKNLGNCAAFNRALSLVTGKYVIDFAADDVMLPDRIAKQVRFFETLDDSYGVVFTDAEYSNETGAHLYNHYEALFKKGLLKEIYQGDVYANLLSTYFVASPTMMVRTSVMVELGGYDEQLSYEDFDFWIRSSRNYKYAFLDERLTKIRKSTRSMSTGWYKQGDKQLYSTYLVCKKALQLNRTPQDTLALRKRLEFEIRQAVFSQNNDQAKLFYSLLKEIGTVTTPYRLLIWINELKLPLSFLRNWYHAWLYH